MKTMLFAVAASAALLGTAPAHAQVSKLWQQPYVGVGVSTADRITHLPGAITPTDDWKVSGRVFAGLQFDETFGAEIGYTDFSDSSVIYAISNVRGRLDARAEAWYLAGKATAPITDKFSMYGKLGVSRNKWKQSGVGPGRLFREDNDTEAYLALGTEWRITPKIGMSLEYERYGGSKTFGPKPNVWSINANYRF